MNKFEVPIVYRGQCNFIVEAENAEAAKSLAESKFNNGDRPDDLGNEWEEIERIGDAELMIFPYSKVELLVPHGSIEKDERYGWFAGCMAGDRMTVQDIAETSNKSIEEAMQAAKLLIAEGHLKTVGVAIYKAAYKPQLTVAQINFFEVEIRNEQNGGQTPAILDSAVDSLNQAPNDVIIEWCNDGTVNDDEGVNEFKQSIVSLVAEFGGSTTLDSLLPE
jgi:hypothetical protein